MLKSMRKSKNRYFLSHFGFPWGRPWAITLNVVWMEREFDAYKLSRCMCPSYPLAFDAPVRGVPVGIAPPRLVWKN